MTCHDQLKQRLREFADARDWEQFHSPKNLSMALIVEAAELVEHFREVEAEMADIFIYLVRMADRLGVDLLDAARRKIEVNERKYPADQVRGTADKPKGQ